MPLSRASTRGRYSRIVGVTLLYRPSPAVGHMCVPELFYVRLELPLYPDHVLVGQPHCAMMVWAPIPRHRPCFVTPLLVLGI